MIEEYKRLKTICVNNKDFMWEKTKCRSIVHLVTRVKGKGRLYALKEILKNDRLEELHKKEIDLLRKLRSSKFVPTLIHAFESPTNYHLVMEYMPANFELLLYYKDIVNQNNLKFYMSNLFIAVEHLHKENIVHGFIKPSHILVAENGYLKLTDYTHAFEGTKYKKEKYDFGNFHTMSHELIDLQLGGEITQKTDYYSLGVLMLECVNKEPSLEDHEDENDPPYHKIKAKVPKETKELIENLLQNEQELRPGSFTDVTKFDYFQGVEWEALELQTFPAPYIPETESEKNLQSTNEPSFHEDLTDDEVEEIAAGISKIQIDPNQFRGKDLKEIKEYFRSLMVEIGPNEFKCRYKECNGSVCFSIKASNQHADRHAAKFAKIFKCEKCKSTFISKDKLEMHKCKKA